MAVCMDSIHVYLGLLFLRIVSRVLHPAKPNRSYLGQTTMGDLLSDHERNHAPTEEVSMWKLEFDIFTKHFGTWRELRIYVMAPITDFSWVNSFRVTTPNGLIWNFLINPTDKWWRELT